MGCSSSKDYSDGENQSSGDSAHMHTIAPTAEDAARRVRPHRRAARCPASARSSLERPATSTAAPAGDGSAAELIGAVSCRGASSGGGSDTAAAARVRPASSAPVNTKQEKRAREALRRRVQRDLQYSGVQLDRMFRDHFFGGSAENSTRVILA